MTRQHTMTLDNETLIDHNKDNNTTHIYTYIVQAASAAMLGQMVQRCGWSTYYANARNK